MTNLAPSALDLSPDEFRRLGHRAVELAASYLENVGDRAVFRPMTRDEREELLDLRMPENGLPPEDALDVVERQIFSHPMGNGHPRFFGWVNSPPAPVAAVADLLAAALNPSCAGGNHAAIYLEHAVLRWLSELVGLPTDSSKGILVSGGSMATLTALAVARQWAAAVDGWDVRVEGLPGTRPTYVLYTSEEGHSCIRKSVELLGLGSRALRVVPVDERFQLNLDALQGMIAEDRGAGRRPFCVAASAGTVNTGAIDPLDRLADICEAEGLLLHVDGAYGAVGVLDPSVAPRYSGLARADSLALDPHKWLSVPVECGCVLVREGKLLRDTFSLVPPYLRTEDGKGFGGLPWFSEYGFQQSRGFRALKLWMTLRQAGRSGVAAHVARCNALARHLAELIDAEPDLERLAPVELSIVCFRYAPERLRGDDTALNALNKALMESIQAGGEAFVSSTMLRGTFALRACILHYGTTEPDVAALAELVRREGARLVSDILAPRRQED